MLAKALDWERLTKQNSYFFAALYNRVLRTVPSEERLLGALFKSLKTTALK